MSDYRDGYYDGMKNALRIVRQAQLAPNTRCSEPDYGAAQRRIARVLAGAVERNEPVPVAPSELQRATEQQQRDRHVLNRLDALLGYHQERAATATAENADSMAANVERARAAGVRDARAVFLANAVSGTATPADQPASEYGETDRRINAAIEWGRQHAQEVSVLGLFRALECIPPADQGELCPDCSKHYGEPVRLSTCVHAPADQGEQDPLSASYRHQDGES